jgi:hypothetical protein
MAFTEQGVAMLSSVLNSERAIMINIQITRMRQIALLQKNNDLCKPAKIYDLVFSAKQVQE